MCPLLTQMPFSGRSEVNMTQTLEFFSAHFFFLYKGWGFIALKENMVLRELGSLLFYEPLSIGTVVYFSHPETCTNGSQIHAAQPSAVGERSY